MPRTLAPFAASRRSAIARLAWLKRVASVGGVSLAALGLVAPATAQEAPADDGDRRSRAAERLEAFRARISRRAIPGEVRPARADERARAAARTAGGSPPPTFVPGMIGPGSPPAPLPPYTGAAQPALVDIDGDGDLDLFTGLGSTPPMGPAPYYQAYVAFNVGAADAPDFAFQVPFGLTSPSYYPSPAFGDFDGDGDFDSIIADAFGAVAYTENDGTATTPDFSTVPPVLVAGIPPLLPVFASPAVGDLDGDGDLDLIVGTYANPYSPYGPADGGGLFYFENVTAAPGPPVFGPPVDLAPPSPGPPPPSPVMFRPELGDMDGDGDLDLLVGASYYFGGPGVLLYAENVSGASDGPPVFLPPAPIFPLLAAPSPDPAIGDLDGDGDLDLLIGDYSGGFSFLENTGNTTGELTTSLGVGGWTFLGSPAPAATHDALLDDPLWIQGATGGDATAGTPNAYTWDETTQDWAPLTDLSGAAGTDGLVVYVFADDDADGTADPFPKTIDVPGPAPLVPGATATFGVSGADYPLTYTSGTDPTLDGFNLLTAPTANWFDWSGVELTDVGTTVYVYDPAVSTYKTYDQVTGEGTPPTDLPGGVIGPFQSFFVEAESASAVFELRPAASSGGPMLGRTATPDLGVIGFSLRPDATSAATTLPAQIGAGVTLAFGVEGALAGFGREDAPALAPIAAPSLGTWTEAADNAGAMVPLVVDKRPWPSGPAEVPLAVTLRGSAAGEPLELSWPRLDGVPDGWGLTLVDHVTGAEVDLRTETAYRFVATADDVSARSASPTDGGAQAVPALGPLTVGTRSATARTDAPRFSLLVAPAAVAAEEGPAGADVSLVRPNPTTGYAAVRVSLSAAQSVRVTVLDVLGREVARAHDGPLSGTAEVSLDVRTLAPGVYVIRVDGETFSESRPLTIVR